jgi:superfamily II DNA or RNA helicase
MWTTINKDHYDEFIMDNYELYDYKDNLILREDPVNNILYLPRYIYYNYPHTKLNITTDNTWNIKYFNNNIEFNGILKSNQSKISDYILSRIKNNKKIGIIKASPGFGKTVLGIYIASKLNYKTLIIVDKDMLITGEDQWIDSILKFTNIKKEQIGIIRGNIFTANENSLIVFGMVQTFISKIKTDFENFYNKIKNLGINLVIFDECHKTAAAPNYAKCSLFFNTPNILGLSATPYNNNLHNIMITNTIGDVIINNDTYELEPIYVIAKYNSEINEKQQSIVLRCNDYIKRRGIYNKLISNSKNLYNIVHKLTSTLLKMGHRVLIIGWTKVQIINTSEKLTNNGITNRKYYGDSKTVDKENDTVIITTYKHGSDAMNIKKISSLIIMCPLSGTISLIQCSGRILRESPDKIQPIVFQLIDDSFNGMFINEIPKIKKIIQNEFKCEIKEINI